MSTLSQRTSTIIPGKPFFARKEKLSQIQTLSVRNPGSGLSAGRYCSDQPLGITTPNQPAPVVMAVVRLSESCRHVGWRNGQPLAVPPRSYGAFQCYDMRETWSFDVSFAVDSLHFYIPYKALDEFTEMHGLAKIGQIVTPIAENFHDKTVLGLAESLLPCWQNPGRHPRCSATTSSTPYSAISP